nr:FAD-dependent oxidoreductase [Ruegeria sp. HKCCD8929]
MFVIGGGSGCVRAARVAAQTGARVGQTEEYRYGGTYVIRGCVPKKLMVFASEFSVAVGDATEYGWQVVTGGFDWPAFKSKMHSEPHRLEGVHRSVLTNNGVSTFGSRAILAGPNTVELGDGAQKTAKYIPMATGGRPVLPGIKGDHIGLSSNGVFHLDELPKSILILRGFDDQARGLVSEEMCQRGVELHLGNSDLAMQPQNGGIQVLVSNGQNRVFDKVMFATGRTPDSDGLGLEKTEFETGRNGEIIADRFSQTSVPSIYAIGDVTDRVNPTPVAVREGMAFFETVFCNNPTSPDHELIPTAIFTQPEMGTVGLSEEAARAQEAIEIYATSFRPIQSSFAGRTERVLMKLVVRQQSRKVLGCYTVASGAGEMIQRAGIAIKMGATKEDFDRVVAVHPSVSEELVTMKEPACRA